MSPYRFAMVMEYISRYLFTLSTNPLFGFHLKCKRVGLTALLFADDLLIFSRGYTLSVALIKEELSKFSMASGLHANCEKTVIYTERVCHRRVLCKLVKYLTCH